MIHLCHIFILLWCRRQVPRVHKYVITPHSQYVLNANYWSAAPRRDLIGRIEHQINLTHWGRVTHICVRTLTIIGSNNGLSPGRHQAILWTNAGILFIRTKQKHVNEILIEIHIFSFKKMHLKMSSAKWRLFCLGLNVLPSYMCSQN